MNPLSTPPNQTSPALGLTGSYSLQPQAWEQYPGYRLFKITAFHLATSTGDTYDPEPTSPYRDMYCSDSTHECNGFLSLAASNAPGELTELSFNNDVPNQWKAEGDPAKPSGFDWSPTNPSLPPGVGILNNDGVVAVLSFHATRTGIDTIPPTVSLYTPANGDAVRGRARTCPRRGRASTTNRASSRAPGHSAPVRCSTRRHWERTRSRSPALTSKATPRR